ncbi:MAG: pyridoxamine 5'-phosphate oxidase family protein [Dehalococcoidales bacterium]|nr:pyridoxamine 5'-phosphate oxidase family protein [Dehalococcoidales bacterium]
MKQIELIYADATQSILEEIHKHKTGVLATTDGTTVSAREMVFIYDGLTIFCRSEGLFKKFRQIEANANVAIAAGNIQIEGIASIQGHPLEETNNRFIQLYKEQIPQAYEVACRDYFPRADCKLIAIIPKKITLYVAGPSAEKAGYSFSGYFDILNVEKQTAHRVPIWDVGESTAYYDS